MIKPLCWTEIRFLCVDRCVQQWTTLHCCEVLFIFPQQSLQQHKSLRKKTNKLKTFLIYFCKMIEKNQNDGIEIIWQTVKVYQRKRSVWIPDIYIHICCICSLATTELITSDIWRPKFPFSTLDSSAQLPSLCLRPSHQWAEGARTNTRIEKTRKCPCFRTEPKLNLTSIKRDAWHSCIIWPLFYWCI